MSDFLLSVPGRLTALITKVDTLLTRWTQVKADYIDAGISTRAPGSTALDNTVWTGARAARLDNIDYLVAAAASDVGNPILNPVNALNGIGNIVGLGAITTPYGIANTIPIVATLAATYYTAINIVGAGVVNYLDLKILSGASGIGSFRLTLDGVSMVVATMTGNGNGNLIFGLLSSTGQVSLEEIPFRNNFKLEIASVGAGAQFVSRYRYRRTA